MQIEDKNILEQKPELELRQVFRKDELLSLVKKAVQNGGKLPKGFTVNYFEVYLMEASGELIITAVSRNNDPSR